MSDVGTIEPGQCCMLEHARGAGWLAGWLPLFFLCG